MRSDIIKTKSPSPLVYCTVAVLSILGLLIVHGPAFMCRATSFDDRAYLLNNRLVKNPGLDSAKKFFTEIASPSTIPGYYQPITMISLMMDYHIFGQTDDLRPYHLTNVTLHILNTLLIIVILFLLFRDFSLACVAGLLFGLHPITVEPVAWISERKTLLASFFGFWSILFYILYVRSKRRKLLVSSLLVYFLALLSKPVVLTLPLLLLILDYWPIKRLSRKSLYEKTGYFILAAIFAFVSFSSQRSTAGIRLPHEYGYSRIPLVCCHNFLFYLRNIFWPARLSAFYPFPNLTIQHPFVIGGGLLFLLVLALVILLTIKRNRAYAGFFFFWIAIAPTMQVFQVSDVITSDKFLYWPLLGVLLLIIPFAFFLCTTKFFCGSYRARRRVILVLAAVIMLTEGVFTHRTYSNWLNDEQHITNMVECAPNSLKLRHLYGLYLHDNGMYYEAVEHFQEGLDLEVEPHLHGVIKRDVYSALARTLVELKKYKEAKLCFEKSIESRVVNPSRLNNFAWFLSTCKDCTFRDGTRAIVLAKLACRLTDHTRWDFIDTLAAAYAEAGDFKVAVKWQKKAVAFAMQNQPEEAETARARLLCYSKEMAYREN